LQEWKSQQMASAAAPHYAAIHIPSCFVPLDFDASAATAAAQKYP
jgi:hypothetical protein